MTDEQVVKNLKDHFGLGNIYGYQPKRKNSKYVWHWTVMNQNCRDVLTQIVPYLQVKKDLAERVLALPVYPRGVPKRLRTTPVASPIYNTK